jgi:ATP-dependent exoDNAse (exonuclease V) beta subunit
VRSRRKEIFAGPQITQLFEDQDYSKNLNSTERRARKAFERACRNFLGNEKAENYSEILQAVISLYSAEGRNMSQKLNFLHSQLDIFSLKTREPSPMNMVKDSNTKFPKLKRGTMENGVQICWLTTAGVL